mmetsp:Transcript_105218/g.234879  ORF Transcript_105218/g.234879 Transcript_105218/m.234879 type:complete len:388 (-) Transcript_105218:53-1216(-)
MIPSDQIGPLCVAAVLVALSGLFSGLNLGLMSFTDDDLRIIIEGSSEPQEVANAKRIRPLRKRGNLLLCTLLLGNTLVNAMIAILLADIAAGLVGGLITTGLIVVFGEIIPQSVCSRYALAIGAKSVPIVWFFLIVCFVIAYPVSVLLDYLLGREMGGLYSKGELMALIQLNTSDPERAKEVGMTCADAKLVVGALSYKNQPVSNQMTRLDCVFSLSIDTIFDKDAFLQVLQKGHTRIPVFEGAPDNIVSVLYCKNLLGIGFEHKISLRQVTKTFKSQNRLIRIPASSSCGEAFDICMKERQHLLLVTDDKEAIENGPIVGIITMEDIMEMILQEDILGEDDEFHKVASPDLKRQNSRRNDPSILLREFDPAGMDAAFTLPGAPVVD